MENTSEFDSFEMQLNNAAKDFLRTASGWAMFLSVIGFVFLGLSLLGTLGIFAAADTLSNTPGAEDAFGGMSPLTIGALFLISTIFFFFPVLYLFKFSTSIRKAINENNTDVLTRSFGNLKNYFMWSGILTIVWIITYIAFIVLAVKTQLGNM